MDAPPPVILFLAHRRLSHLRECLSAASGASGFDRFRVIVVVDGASREVVDLVREQVDADLLLEVIDRPSLGAEGRISFALKAGMRLAFDAFSAPYVIVLEDDIVVAPDFLQFVEASHAKFSRDKHYRGVNGFSKINAREDREIVKGEVVKLNYGLGWGWSITEKIYRSTLRHWLPQREHLDWDGMLEPFIRTGFVVNPVVSRIRNIGFDESASHTHSETSERLGVEINNSFSGNHKKPPSSPEPLRVSARPFPWRKDCLNLESLPPALTKLLFLARSIDALAYKVELAKSPFLREGAFLLRRFLKKRLFGKVFYRSPYNGL